jgi:uncharacterized protein YndB with AHSA1/START domain
MENEKWITITRIIDAPRTRLWQAWTDEKQVQKWWAPNGFTNPVCEIDAKVGGQIKIVMLAGDTLGSMSGMKAPMQGVFTEVIKPDPSNPEGQAKLVFTNQAIDEHGNVVLDGKTEVTFEDEGGKTKLTVKTGAKGLVPQAPMMLAGMEQGWNEQMDKLEKFVAQ